MLWKICNYESKDLENKHEESQSKVSVPISIRSSKSEFLEGTRSDDNEEEKDSVLIHSEVSEEMLIDLSTPESNELIRDSDNNNEATYLDYLSNTQQSDLNITENCIYIR